MAFGVAATCGFFPRKNADDGDRAYFTLIDNALRHKANRQFRNNKPAHAVYLLNRFFACARSNVRIYSGRLARTVGGLPAFADPQVAESAIGFLRRADSCLSVVILGEPDVDPGQPIGSHPLLAAISAAKGIRGTVRVSRGNPAEWKEFPYHFVVMDRDAVRIEFDGNCADAAAKFGDAHFAGRLATIFDEYERTGSLLFRRDPAPGPAPDHARDAALRTDRDHRRKTED